MNIRDWNKCIDLAFTAIFFAYFVVFSKLQEIELHDKTINCYKLRPRKHDRQYVNPHILMTLYSVRMYKKNVAQLRYVNSFLCEYMDMVMDEVEIEE